MSILYKTQATAVGGRNGSVSTDDGLLDLQLSLPTALGGKGEATNPEQLFAAGYAACFGNAIIHTTRNKAIKIEDNDVDVTASVHLQANDKGGFDLGVALDVSLTGVDATQAEEIVALAHQVCPYSNALRGNVDVQLSIQTR